MDIWMWLVISAMKLSSTNVAWYVGIPDMEAVPGLMASAWDGEKSWTSAGDYGDGIVIFVTR